MQAGDGGDLELGRGRGGWEEGRGGRRVDVNRPGDWPSMEERKDGHQASQVVLFKGAGTWRRSHLGDR